jgi:hypothetical protein
VTIRPLAEATRVLVPVLWAYVALACVRLGRSALYFLDIVTRLRGSLALAWTASLTDDSQLYVGCAGLVELAVIITFLWWVYRANGNLRALSGMTLDFTPGWAVGWFFVPFANLVVPYRVVRELWVCSFQGKAETGATTVGWWWGAFISGQLLSVLAWRSAGFVGS